jgi:serine/threonine protein kinase
MEYLHGETLGNIARRAWSAQGALPRELGVRLVADAARGSTHAHELKADDGENAHVVHRDVSPENVFVTYSGNAKVVDSASPAPTTSSTSAPPRASSRASWRTCPPSSSTSAASTAARDVWALGVVLWEVTVGRRLFRRQTDAATVFAITRDPHHPAPPPCAATTPRAWRRW